MIDYAILSPAGSESYPDALHDRSMNPECYAT